MGTFAGTGTDRFVSDQQNIYTFGDSIGDAIDLHVSAGVPAFFTPTVFPPTVSADLWNCTSSPCIQFILPPGTGPSGQLAIRRGLASQFTVTEVPELSTFALLGFGIVGIGVVRFRKRVKD